MLTLLCGRLCRVRLCRLCHFLPANKFESPLSLYPTFNIFSSIPSVIPNTNTTEVVIAPSAENVGQAQILGELGNPLELRDCLEKTRMDVVRPFRRRGVVCRNQTEVDDLISRIPRKRSLSPTTVGPEQNRTRASKHLRKIYPVHQYMQPC